MSTAIKTERAPLDWDFVKRSAWLGTRISLCVLAPISIFCWLTIGGMLLYRCVEAGMSPIDFLRAIDKATLTKILYGLVSATMLCVLGVAMSAGIGAAVAAGAVGCSKLCRRIIR